MDELKRNNVEKKTRKHQAIYLNKKINKNLFEIKEILKRSRSGMALIKFLLY